MEWVWIIKISSALYSMVYWFPKESACNSSWAIFLCSQLQSNRHHSSVLLQINIFVHIDTFCKFLSRVWKWLHNLSMGIHQYIYMGLLCILFSQSPTMLKGWIGHISYQWILYSVYSRWLSEDFFTHDIFIEQLIVHSRNHSYSLDDCISVPIRHTKPEYILFAWLVVVVAIWKCRNFVTNL